jgi:hypothetical protein
LNTPLSSVEDVFGKINEFLDYADGKILNTSTVRGSNMAVKALKAKVYLHQERWQDAINEATYVIENGSFSLLENFADLYLTEENNESIFEVSFDDQDKNRLAEYFYPTQLTGRYEVAPNQEFIESFEENDSRSGVTIKVISDEPYVDKYEEISTGGDNVYVFRLAEMYMIRAEARANLAQELNEALDDVNMLRERAKLPDANTATYEELLLIIEDERRHEFAFEGHRWFDLVRTDRAIDVLPTVDSRGQYYFPIPLAETNTNDAINN